MKNSFIYLLFWPLMAMGCQNAASPNSKGPTLQASLEDSLYKAVLALHDKAMPKMGKIIGFKKTAQARIDSLKQISNAAKIAALQTKISRYEELINQLSAAEKGMNDWMEGFNPDPAGEDQIAKINYFKAAKVKAEKMKTDIFSAIDSASMLLK